MGQINIKQIVIVSICFLFTGLLVYLKPIPEHDETTKKTTLKSSLMTIDGWQKIGDSSFDRKIVDALLLDDYVSLQYTNGEDTVSLYVGYYWSAKKVGAAHDPMVCFPGQGWKISQKKTGSVSLASGKTVNYASMVGELGQKKQLIVYWFQAHDVTNANTLSQKVSLFWKKLTGKGDDNAFVRVTVPCDNNDIPEAEKIAQKFIQDFYPVFFDYITANPEE